MKTKITLLLCVLFIACYVQAQTTSRFYKFRGTTQLLECEKNGKETGGSQNIPGGSKFTVIGSIGDNNIIQLWNWDTTGYYVASRKNDSAQTDDDKKKVAKADKARRLNYNPATGAVRYFLLPKTELEWNTQELIRQWNPLLGGVVLPFKMRTQPVDFTTNLSLATLGGLRFTIPSQRFSVGLVGGVGLATVVLDQYNTKGGVTEASDRAAVFLSYGAVLQFERVQAVILSGADWVSTRERKGWIYQGKPWFSVGIGFSIFSDQIEPRKESGVNN